eukprot:SAG31_NODE_46691_length_253_cov_0.779221_1_plen_35_part_01
MQACALRQAFVGTYLLSVILRASASERVDVLVHLV